MSHQHKPEKTTGNGIASEVSNVTSRVAQHPEIQGWLALAIATLLVLYVLGFFTTLINYIILAVAAYLFIQGGIQTHLFDKLQHLVAWARSKF